MNAVPRRAQVVQRQVLADHVYDALLASLVDGRFSAGSPLTIDRLAREMDVSQTPIREALARLESTGLVRRNALKGYRVAPPPTSEEVAELLDARLLLEPDNTRRATEHLTDEVLATLRASIEDLASSPRGPSFSQFREYWEADERFHLAIAEAGHNQFLLRAYRSLGGQVQRFRLFAGLGVTDAEYAIAEHRTILRALESGDAEAARRAMVEHLLGVRGRAIDESERLETGA